MATEWEILEKMPCENEENTHMIGIGEPPFLPDEAAAVEKVLADQGCAGCQFAHRICKVITDVRQLNADGTSLQITVTPNMDWEAAKRELEDS